MCSPCSVPIRVDLLVILAGDFYCFSRISFDSISIQVSLALGQCASASLWPPLIPLKLLVLIHSQVPLSSVQAQLFSGGFVLATFRSRTSSPASSSASFPSVCSSCGLGLAQVFAIVVHRVVLSDLWIAYR
jgi:hypothetical protein